MARVRGGNTGYAVALVIFGCAFVITLLIAIIFYTKIEAAEKLVTDKEGELRKYVALDEEGPATSDAKDGMTTYKSLKTEIGELKAQINTLTTENSEAKDDSADKESAFDNLATTKEQVDARLLALQAEYAEYKRDRESELTALTREKDTLASKLADFGVEVSTGINAARTNANTSIGEMTQKVGELENTIRGLEDELLAVETDRAKLRGLLPKPPERNTTLPDGRVASVFDNGRDLFINLGRKDGIVMGMTFEVFDPNPVIRLSAQGEARGKATVEVYALDKDSATCRVVRMARGEQIDPEDPIVNIAYDPNMDITFYVFGQFDIERDGGTNDIERIKGLITKVGAEVAELQLGEGGIPVLTPDLDYIVLGEEPILGKKPDGDGIDLEAVAAYNAKKAEVESYFRIVEDAKALRIPVLNQNRFLELNGYYVR